MFLKIIYFAILCTLLSPIVAAAENAGDSNLLTFEEAVNFSSNQILNPKQFTSAIFQQSADFHSRIFPDSTSFKSAHFYGPSRFDNDLFNHFISFNEAVFEKKAYFHKSQFKDVARFFGTEFKEKVKFNGTNFKTNAYFNNVQFQDSCDFRSAKFEGAVNFYKARFNSYSDFSYASFKSNIDFFYADINGPMTFQNVSAENITFHGAVIHDKIYLGNDIVPAYPRVDFTKASFAEIEDQARKREGKKFIGGQIILVGPVNIAMQIEKFNHIALLDTLDYFTKKNIIETLKEESFPKENQATARFELDYILAKSTLMQEKSAVYSPFKFRHINRWPHFIKSGLYYITMGLGYRPFNLLWWAFGIVFIFAVVYSIWIPDRLREFIALEWKHHKPSESKTPASRFSLFYENALISFYFSNSIFFALRFNKDIFNFFGRREKVWISIEWLLGIIFYVAFFALAQSGSILHRLLGLFV